MNSKSHMSVRTKKILLGTGIAFGTVLVFVVSFFLSFSLIINPISFSTFGSDDVAAENEELKTQVQTLEDEVEHLNATVDKYKNNINTPAPATTVNTPVQTQPQSSTGESASDTSSNAGAVVEAPQTPADNNQSSTAGDTSTENNEGFIPDTVTTPEGGFEPEVEPDITVIDVSE